MSDIPAPESAISRAIRGHLDRLFIILKRAAWRSSLRIWSQPVTYLGVAMLVFIYCALTYLIVTDRKTAEYDAGNRGDNLVRVVDQSFSHIFKAIDISLLYLGKSFQQNPSAFNLSSWAHDPAVKNDLTFNFMICDTNGRVVDSSFSKEIIGTDRSGQESFQAHLNSAEDRLLIGRPLILKDNGKWVIPLSRRITAQDGTFAGVITALLDPSVLIKDIGAIDLGQQGSIALVGLDSYLRTRSVNGKVDWENIGREVRLIPETLGRAFQFSEGHYWSVPGVFNNVRRLISYRVLKYYPQIALVTIPEADVFQRADENARNYWTIALTLTALILMAIAFGGVRQRKLNDAIAEMKRAQSAMRQSQERYRLVEEAVNDGIWDLDIVTGAGYRSPRWAEILGYRHDELSPDASAFRELIHPADKERVDTAIRAHLEDDNPYDIEFRLRQKNGDYRWIQSRGKAVRDEEGRAIRMLGTITDIGERKRAETLIEESLVNLARAEAMTHMGHYKYDMTTNSYSWSDGLYKIMNKSRDTFTPSFETTMALVHPEDRPILERYRRDVLAGHNVSTVTTRGVRSDGSIVYVELWSAPIRGPNGTVTGMFGTSRDVTARVKAEAAVKETRDNLARAEEIALLGHTRLDLASGDYTWSAGVYRIMRKSPDTFKPTPENTLELLHPDDREEHRRHRDEVLSGAEVNRKTIRAIVDNGVTIYVEFWSVPIRDKAGVITGKFSTLQDVTAKIRAEAELAASHDNLAHAESMVLLGHYKYDLRTQKLHWSKGAYRVMGRSPETFEPISESVIDLFHPEDRPVVLRHRADVLAGRSPPPVTARVSKDSGEIAFVQSWSKPIFDANDNVVGYFGTTQDITERKRAQDLVDESLANLERAERLALLGHYKIDRNTGILTWSEGIYRIFGLSSENYTPTLRDALELIHPDDRPILKRFRNEAMAGKEIPHATMRGLKSDGHVIDIEYWSTPVRDSDGNITGVFGTVQDVTLRKRAEDALAHANHELETRVHERTAELAAEMRRREEAQMTLGQMQKMEAVGQLTAGIAHDFNNLLAVIGGGLEFVDQAAARGLTADPELIDAALRATRRGSELVRRLLAFSRQSPLRAEPTVINQLVLDTLRLLQRTLGQGIDMVTRLDADAALVSVDRNQMANALLNLALNARDAMPDGGQLTIATDCRPLQSTAGKITTRSPKDEDVCITISDTGTGMTDDVRKRAFEPFFTTKADGLGSGLGLSMVQGFVEQSGGQIDIDSEPGRGTVITIRLPRIAATDAADDFEPARGTTGTARNKTVLLVEDDPDVRVVTAAQLKNLGYKVHAVANGMEAIDLIASPANIDITLTDIVLPGGFDGVELIKEAMRARPSMGVLCMSGYDPTQKHRKWLQVQNINFLQKPFTSNRLAQALDAALAH